MRFTWDSNFWTILPSSQALFWLVATPSTATRYRTINNSAIKWDYIGWSKSVLLPSVKEILSNKQIKYRQIIFRRAPQPRSSGLTIYYPETFPLLRLYGIKRRNFRYINLMGYDIPKLSVYYLIISRIFLDITPYRHIIETFSVYHFVSKPLQR
jgi:hypothetical protein